MNQFRRQRWLRAIDPVLPVWAGGFESLQDGFGPGPTPFLLERSEEFVRRFPKAGKGTPRPAEYLVLEQMTVLTRGFSLPGTLESCRTGHGQSSGANPGGREGRKEGRAHN